MTANDVLAPYTKPWMADHRQTFLRALAPLLALPMAWWLASSSIPAIVWAGLIVYGLIHLAIYSLESSARTTPSIRQTIALAGVLTDFVLGLLLLQQSHTLANAICPLYILIALRVVCVYQYHPFATITPLLLGPLYLFSLYSQPGQPAPLDPLIQWSLLLGSLGFGAVAIWSNAGQQRAIATLQHELQSERQRSGERITNIEHQHQLLHALFHTINDGVLVIDATDQFVLINPPAQRIINTPYLAVLIHTRLIEMVARVRSEPGAFVMMELHADAQQDLTRDPPAYRAFASTLHPEHTDQQLIAIVIHDITAQKAEERAHTEFISMVSHELRNPLHSVNGFVKVVLQGRAGPLTSTQEDFLQMAASQIEQLKGRIAELLEFNRFKAGRLALRPEPNYLSPLVSSIISQLSLQIEQANLSIVNQVAYNLPQLYFDTERIGQVLTNLIENAIKATPAGGTISISSEVLHAAVQMRVSDTGIGIPAHEVNNVFQRFYQVPGHQNAAKGNHLGLGLAICQQIIEGHEGRIWVESEEHVGTTFIFSLPFENQVVETQAVPA